MAEFDYQNVEAWNTAIKLTTAVGRLRVGSNLKASADAQTEAFKQAGMAAALIAEASGREGGAQVSLYRDARGSLAQVRSWLHVLASLMNEQDTVFGGGVRPRRAVRAAGFRDVAHDRPWPRADAEPAASASPDARTRASAGRAA